MHPYSLAKWGKCRRNLVLLAESNAVNVKHRNGTAFFCTAVALHVKHKLSIHELRAAVSRQCWNFLLACFVSKPLAGLVGSRKGSLKKTDEGPVESLDNEFSSKAYCREGLECPICGDFFNIVENIPYVLWCGHTLCKNCVLGMHRAIIKFPALSIRLPFLISCPWCNSLSLRLMYHGNLKFPCKNFFLLWMVESINYNGIKSGFCGDHLPLWSLKRNLVIGNQVSNINHTPATSNLATQHLDSNSSIGHCISNYFNALKLCSSLPSAAILALYMLITVLFALPSLLVLKPLHGDFNCYTLLDIHWVNNLTTLPVSVVKILIHGMPSQAASLLLQMVSFSNQPTIGDWHELIDNAFDLTNAAALCFYNILCRLKLLGCNSISRWSCFTFIPDISTMAEDTNVIDIPVIEEVIECPDIGIRRYTTGRIDLMNGPPKVLSRYLKPSSASCHDLCKYGRHHSLNGKTPKSRIKGVTIGPIRGQSLAKTVASPAGKQKPPKKRFPDLKMEIPPVPVVIKIEIPSTPKDCTVVYVPENEPDVSKLKFVKNRQSSLPPLRSSSAKENNDTKTTSARKSGTNAKTKASGMGGKKNLAPRTVSQPRGPPLHRAASMKPKSSKDSGGVTSLKSKMNIRKDEAEQAENEIVEEKTLYVIEPESKIGNTEPTADLISPSSEKKIQPVEKGTRPSPPPSQSKKKSLRHGSNGNYISKLPSSEGNKSLRLTRNGVQIRKKSSSSPLSNSAVSSPALSKKGQQCADPDSMLIKTISSMESKTANQKQKLKAEGKDRPQRVGPDGKDLTQKMLSFRRGKVVDPQIESHSPRRLKFMQARVLSDNQNKGDPKKRTCTRKELIDGQLNNTKTGNVKVVLRHQAAPRKTTSKSLLNNVIEETASRLVETKKSKVKALVGAFESVISLQ
ncbi:Zinc finger, RING-type, eukaryotic [Dillenia turbinata]|uniref:Zinc finger, RING-type, eukaryotic n=1 Tax=Dillenia turbinata TaxID=194707 RepID=A0AAN8Z3H2_9MAGN